MSHRAPHPTPAMCAVSPGYLMNAFAHVASVWRITIDGGLRGWCPPGVRSPSLPAAPRVGVNSTALLLQLWPPALPTSWVGSRESWKAERCPRGLSLPFSSRKNLQPETVSAPTTRCAASAPALPHSQLSRGAGPSCPGPRPGQCPLMCTFSPLPPMREAGRGIW